MSRSPDDHVCAWKGEAERRRADLERLRDELGEIEKFCGEFAALKRQVFGKQRERVEPLERAVRKERLLDLERVQQVRAERGRMERARPFAAAIFFGAFGPVCLGRAEKK